MGKRISAVVLFRGCEFRVPGHADEAYRDQCAKRKPLGTKISRAMARGFLSAVLVLGLSAMASAEGMANYGKMGKGPGMGMGGGMGGAMMVMPKMALAMASELNLTADQMEKLKKLDSEMPEKGVNRDGMKKDRDAMKAELEKDSPDEAKIADMMKKMSEKHQAAMKQRVHTMLAVKAVLTKGQWEKLKKMKEDKKAGKGKGRGKKKK